MRLDVNGQRSEVTPSPIDSVASRSLALSGFHLRRGSRRRSIETQVDAA